MTMTENPKVIDIFVECYWELRTKEFDSKKVLDRKYVDKYHGGWNIVKCPGYPSINGGMGTPDMCALYPTVQSVRQHFIKQYSERYPDHKINIHLKVTKDDRNPGIDSFF